MPKKHKSDQKPKLVPITTVLVTDELNFETEYLALRLTDTFRLVEKREQLIRSALECLGSVVEDAAQMGLLRKECALFNIKVDPDKERARIGLQQQLVELKEEHKELKKIISAIKAASKASRTVTPADFERLPSDAMQIVLASLNGKAVRYEFGGSEYLAEPIETSDPRVVAALLRGHVGHPVVIE